MKRKMISKIIVAALIGTMCAGMATTVKAADDEKVTLSVINYHVGTDYAAEYYSYLFEAFQQTEEGKNVEFSFEEIPTTDAFNQKIKLLISSGDLPDIVFNGGNNIIELAAKSGKVADLTPYLDADPEWKALFDDTSLEFNTVDGKVYGIPVSKEISYIYYNKDLFEQAGITEAPKTFDELLADCKLLQDQEIIPIAMGGDWPILRYFAQVPFRLTGNEYIENEEPFQFIYQKLTDISEDTENEFERKVELTIRDHGEERTIIGYGNGPIDAVKNAFNDNGYHYIHLLDYSEHALTSGSSAKAAAYVQLRAKGTSIIEWGVGVHPNITTATIKAIISAMNRIHKDMREAA